MSEHIEVVAIVEGKTEQVFVENILAPYLLPQNIIMSATQVTKKGQNGGSVRFEKVKTDIGNHLKQRRGTFVTTVIDYYGTNDWPGLEQATRMKKPADIAKTLNGATMGEICRLYPECNPVNRFIPYVSIHEFEALLFSESAILAEKLGAVKLEIDAVLKECGEPEMINKKPDTAPSKRLKQLSRVVKYKKTTTGIDIAQAIGIDAMRNACPVFNDWIKRIEQKSCAKA